jgi:uncharacterized damage-inducible protein DinB
VTTSPLRDAFAHHVWATLRVLDACAALSPGQLETTVPGTYGSIIGTLRHTIGADSWYLFRTSGERTTPIPDGDEEHMDLAALRTAMEGHAAVWPSVVAGEVDGDTVIVGRADDGSESHATMGIRLAQALHHGSDHRSQVCTALTALGIEPPDIGVWEYGDEHGRVTRVPATA